MRPIISCLRVCSRQQGRSGLGIEAQRNVTNRFAAVEGLKVSEHVEAETGKVANALDRRPTLRATPGRFEVSARRGPSLGDAGALRTSFALWRRPASPAPGYDWWQSFTVSAKACCSHGVVSVLVAPEMAVFLPVQMLELATASAGLSRPEPHSHRHPTHAGSATLGLIEIELGDDRRVRVGSDVNLAALRCVLVALRG